jgi:hypothetical protein
MSSESQVVVTDSRLPTDKFILEGIDVAREPVFTVSEVAKVFFARSPHWVRWRERKGFFVLDGEDVSGQRTDDGARRYNLADIEKMAHALASKGAINGAQLTNALLLVQIEARVWGYL